MTMTYSHVEAVVTRCPYCQGADLTRLAESNSMPIDVFRCHGCGTQFHIDRLRDDDEEPEALMISKPS
jgi:transposase-like protein